VADVKISDLTSAGSAASTDLVEIAQDAGGGSYNARKATVANLRAGLATSGAVTGTGITMATARLLGRTTASTGAIEEISVSGLGLTGGTLSQGAGAWVEISRATASSSATIDFTGISSTYDAYMVEIYNAVPATDQAQMLFRTSTDGGSSYDSGASDYNDRGSSGDSIILTGNIGNAASENGASGYMMIFRPSQAARCQVLFHTVSITGAGVASALHSAGFRAADADVDAMRFLMDSGNITSGTFVLLGRKK
jgi:hypothetical protein